MAGHLPQLVGELVGWVRGSALPLWAGPGFDASRGAFEERLAFDGRPIHDVPQRAMVQARQIAVYAQAACLGWYAPAAAIAVEAADHLVARYARAGGRGGFAFAIDRGGRVSDDRFDLYAQAFVLYALAWVMRVEPKPLYRRTAEALVGHLRGDRLDRNHGGYREQDPVSDPFRKQNPHMHLFEALFELNRSTGDPALADHLDELRRLAATRFRSPATGALHEVFDAAWDVADPRVEPGHEFEWSWLIGRHDEVRTGANASGRTAPDSDLRDRLFEHALRHGLDARTGRVVDAIDGAGTVLDGKSRLWPHTEAIKALAQQRALGRSDCDPILCRLIERLRVVYLREELGGGWVDHVDEQDRAITSVMPASSFYHVMLAAAELARMTDPEPDARSGP